MQKAHSFISSFEPHGPCGRGIPKVSLQVDRIGAFTEWETLKDQWDSLAGRFPFRRWVWLRSWWDGYGGDHDLYVVRVRQAGQIVGLVPWCLRRSVTNGRVLMWIGGGKACADDMGLLCQPGCEHLVGGAVAQWLQTARGADRWHMLDLDGISPDEPSMAALRDVLVRNGQNIRITPQPSCWSIAIPTSWDKYLAMPGKNSRRIVRHLDGQFLQSGRTVYRVAQDLGQAQWAYDKIRQLHQQRWQERGVAGCFSRPDFDRFLWSAAARLHAAGQLHAAWVELDGQIIAGSLGFIIDRTH
jgi:CelD/BcsL family acetyltransferase involved in cellulose biosynthesis